MAIFDDEVAEYECNWKLLVEGGLEAYHFRVAHRNTIAPLFLDNLSSYQCFGPHIRSVLPRSNLSDLREIEREQWEITRHANLVYSFFPTNQFLVQEDHLVWISSTPLSPERTRLRLATVVPVSEMNPERDKYWRANHDLTVKTLIEDFELAQGIQRGMDSGANTHINFGRFEGALARFNKTVESICRLD